MPTPEPLTRQNIDDQLTACGWIVQGALKRYRASLHKAAVEGRLVPLDLIDELAEELLT